LKASSGAHVRADEMILVASPALIAAQGEP
jgi:hypothetical protein